MIRSTLLPEEFHWRGTSSEAEKWEGSLKDFEETGEDSEEIPGNLSFGTRLSNDPAPEVWLNVELPNDQQKKEGATDENEAGQPSLTLSGTTCPRDELNALNEVMENRLKESTKEGENCSTIHFESGECYRVHLAFLLTSILSLSILSLSTSLYAVPNHLLRDL